MSLTTLVLVKQQLGITDTSQDAALTQWLSAAIALARRYTKRWLGGTISGNTLANPTVVTSINHGLETGETVYFYHTNSTPILDGLQTVTRLSRDTFSVPVNCSVAGTAGDYGKQVIEYYGGTGDTGIALRNRPVHSIQAVYQDDTAYYGEASGAFASTTLLVAGTDYCLLRDKPTTSIEQSERGVLLRLVSYWPPRRLRTDGLLTLSSVAGTGNVKVQYTYGLVPVPDDLQEAVAAIVAIMKRTAKIGLPVMSESLDYYSYSLGEVASDVTNVKKILGRYKQVLIS